MEVLGPEATEFIERNMGKHRLLKDIILHVPLRGYFVREVKGPLMEAILRFALKYPEPTKENTFKLNTHTLMDISEELLEKLKFRKDLFKAACRVLVAEVEHDNLYEHVFLFVLERLVEAILDGKIKPMGPKAFVDKYWNDTKPYGGEDSTIYKLIKHREEINHLIGRDKDASTS